MAGEGSPGAVGRSLLAAAWHTVKTVFFAFFGVRRRDEHEAETVKLSPVAVVVTAVAGAAVFVLSLVMLVKFIISRAAG